MRYHLCRRWLRPCEYRCENFPIESYACAEQLPSTYTPPAPLPAALLAPLARDGGNAGAVDGVDPSGGAANGFCRGPAMKVHLSFQKLARLARLYNIL